MKKKWQLRKQFFEYLAAGKIILSTNHSLDLTKFYTDYVETADNKIEFSEKLNEMLSNKTINLQKTFEFGQKQSYPGRAGSKRCLN